MRTTTGLLLVGLGLTQQACKGCKDESMVKPVVDDPGPVHDVGSWLSMEVSPEERPAISYYDRTSGALGYALGTISSSGVTWVREEADGYPDSSGLDPGDYGRYSSLAFAADGTPWIVYQDTTNGTLKYARKADGGWSGGIADTGSGSSSDAGYWASLAIDGSGNPVAVHYDQGGQSLRITRWNGSAFTGAVIDEGGDYVPTDTAADTVPANVGEYAKIAVDGGTEYIAYYDRANGALKLAVGSGTSFDISVVDDGMSGDGVHSNVGQWPDIVVSGGDVYIAYHDATQKQLRIASGRPGSFDIEVVDTAPYTGSDTALFVEGSTPGVFYFDGVQNNQKLARKDGAVWSIDTVTGDTSARGYHNETVSIGGVRYSACYDYTTRAVWFSAVQ